MSNKKRYKTVKQVTLVSAFLNALLGAMKVSLGYLGQSQALMADGIHSLSDLLTDGLVLFASRFGSQAADSDHPYGHQRIETMATVLLALILIMTGFWIAYHGIDLLLWEKLHKPHLYVVWGAFASIVVNEALYHYTAYMGRRIESELLIANAWHHRSDAASSIIVLVGILGSLLSWPFFDTIAAVVVGLMIIKMGWSLGWHNILELVDTGVDQTTLDYINRVIKNVDGVIAIHQLRNRSMGGKTYIDVHVLVDPMLTVSEGHHISQRVHYALMHTVSDVVDVTVHIDPEDDEVAQPSLYLPPREEVIDIICQYWAPLIDLGHIKSMRLHYLDGKIHVELTIDKQHFNEWESKPNREKELLSLVEVLSYVSEIKIIYA